jgi:hypothetical protein
MTPAKLKIKFGGSNQLDLVERLLVWHKQACLILNCKVKSFVARYTASASTVGLDAQPMCSNAISKALLTVLKRAHRFHESIRTCFWLHHLTIGGRCLRALQAG